MLTDARKDDGRKVITTAHPEHSSGELKIKGIVLRFLRPRQTDGVMLSM